MNINTASQGRALLLVPPALVLRPKDEGKEDLQLQVATQHRQHLRHSGEGRKRRERLVEPPREFDCNCCWEMLRALRILQAGYRYF